MNEAQIAQIVTDRLAEWGAELIQQHSTPAILISIGHDHKSGQLTLSVPNDLTTEQAVSFLLFALDAIQKPGRPPVVVTAR